MKILSGNPAHVTPLLNRAVVGMANNGSGLIRVQTSVPHLFGDFSYVHLITTAGVIIDDYFTIVVIDSTHFDLEGSTYTGTGTGNVLDLSLAPSFQVPTDGDDASLQLSGMLSGLQALADRTQYLRTAQIQQTITTLDITASGTYSLPPWTSYVLVLGCGGGGGGGGGMGGTTSISTQYPSGGGGAGAPLFTLWLSRSALPSIVIAIGAGGSGGAGSAGAFVPASSTPGNDGGLTSVALDGVGARLFPGGAGGGGSSTDAPANTTGIPSFVPGGAGGASLRRNGPPSISRISPSPQQMIGIRNTAGTLSVPGGDWPVGVYIDPVGTREPGSGGASVANGSSSTYAAALPYEGAYSRTGYQGGATLGNGTNDVTSIGGAGGGGGGGGAFGNGGVGGEGGTASAAGVAGGGTNGFTPSGYGGGGGGGGGGGSGATPGHGGNGAAGAPGRVFVICFP